MWQLIVRQIEGKLVTRNTNDVARTGVGIIDPFQMRRYTPISTF